MNVPIINVTQDDIDAIRNLGIITHLTRRQRTYGLEPHENKILEEATNEFDMYGLLLIDERGHQK